VTTASIEEQVRLAEDFLQASFRSWAPRPITSSELTNELVELASRGGPGDAYRSKGTTLLALQELTRTVLQRQASPAIAGSSSMSTGKTAQAGGSGPLRSERGCRSQDQQREARFGTMPPSDRKVVHDAINTSKVWGRSRKAKSHTVVSSLSRWPLTPHRACFLVRSPRRNLRWRRDPGS